MRRRDPRRDPHRVAGQLRGLLEAPAPFVAPAHAPGSPEASNERVLVVDRDLPALGIREGDRILVRPGHERSVTLVRSLTIDEAAVLLTEGPWT